MSEIEKEAFAKIREKLIAEEGYENIVYEDTKGKLTVGIGHLVLKNDNLELGDSITDAQVEDFFKKDSSLAFQSACLQARQINRFNVDMIVALTSVNFQLGISWHIEKFPNTWKQLIHAGKGSKLSASKAVRTINNSLWMRQTPKRAKAFVAIIEKQFLA